MRIHIGCLFIVVAAMLPSAPAAFADGEQERKVATVWDSDDTTKRLAKECEFFAANEFTVKELAKDAHVHIFGKDVLISAQSPDNPDGSHRFIFGVDCNANGTIEPEESRTAKDMPVLPASLDFHLKFKADDGQDVDACVVVHDFEAGRRGEFKDAYGMQFRLDLACCKKCSFNGVDIRLFDVAMHGKFSQEGADKWKLHYGHHQPHAFVRMPQSEMISIGNNLAIPLAKRHLIGDKLYDLKVEPDGTAITFTPVKDVRFGKVEIPPEFAAMKFLAFAGDEGCYDLVACKKTGIPVGTYKPCFGHIAKGDFDLRIRFDSYYPDLKIAEGSNPVKLSTPCKVCDCPTIGDGKVNFNGVGVAFTGSNGEIYFNGFTYLLKEALLVSGNKILQRNAHFGFDGLTLPKGDPQDDLKVVITCTKVPNMGTLNAIWTVKELMDQDKGEDKDKPEDKDKDKVKEKEEAN